MRRWTLLLLFALLAPAGAQDDDDIVEDGDPGEAEPEPKRKTPGGGDDEPEAPKHKRRKPTVPNVNKAIKDGVAWLKQRQGTTERVGKNKRVQKEEKGAWGPCIAGRRYGETGEGSGDRECYVSGPTSFSIFTLAKCGVKKNDPVIKKGLKWLRKHHRHTQYITGDASHPNQTTYERASIILMLTALYAPTAPRKPSDNPKKPPAGSKFKKDDWLWMHEHIGFLVGGWQRQKGGTMRPSQTQGGWRYWASRESQEPDASATQFVLLALREAVRAGYPLTTVEPRVWSDAARAVMAFQTGNGAFRYQKDYPWSAGMTAASVASLLICKEGMRLAKQDHDVLTDLDERVKSGIEFLGTVFDVTQNRFEGDTAKEHTNYHYYHLYGLERAGVMSGKREFGGKAWYARGAEFLLNNQALDGSWTDDTCMDPEDVLGTCFALLFLKRATPPPAVTYTGD